MSISSKSKMTRRPNLLDRILPWLSNVISGQGAGPIENMLKILFANLDPKHTYFGYVSKTIPWQQKTNLLF